MRRRQSGRDERHASRKDMLSEGNPIEPLEGSHPVEGPKKITHDEIETTIKKMKNSKASGPPGMTAEMFKGEGNTGIIQTNRRCDALRELLRNRTAGDFIEGVRKGD